MDTRAEFYEQAAMAELSAHAAPTSRELAKAQVFATLALAAAVESSGTLAAFEASLRRIER